MFLVTDTIAERHRHIERFMDGEDAAIAVLLAAVDFERTIRRAILGLGGSPTKDIRANLFGKKFHGLDDFKRGWRDEVKPRLRVNLAGGVVTEWQQFGKAFQQRHKLIHGATGRFSPEFASQTARCIMRASQQVHSFAASKGVNLDRVIRRFNAR